MNRMAMQLKRLNMWIVVLVDLLLLSASFYGSFLIRLDFNIQPRHTDIILDYIGLILIVKLSFLILFNLYRGMWRYTGISDLNSIIKASTLGSLAVVALIGFFWGFLDIPRSIFVLDYILTTIFISGFRLSLRLVLTSRTIRSIRELKNHGNRKVKKRLLIIGAGRAGEKISREINENFKLNYDLVGYLDDDEQKIGRYLHGRKILGHSNDISKFTHLFDEVLICTPSANNKEMSRIVKLIDSCGKNFRTLPSLSELIDGKVTVSQIRDVTLEDLLGRKEVNLDHDSILEFLKSKRILITGAGGSIGCELVKQCLVFAPSDIGLLDFSEENLFNITRRYESGLRGIKIHSFLADIRDSIKMDKLFNDFQPQVIFHAAAYKHVPIQELHPREAVLTNVMGTYNLLKLSIQYKIEKFVLVSTDKAVNPSSVMGATKRVAELLLITNGEANQTKFMAVRFGNVIGSSGSVIPILQEQIRNGGPLTITDPDMERYFMSISEASQLILQAGALGKGGETFILDMGSPIKIDVIADELIKLSGLELGVDIEKIYIGIRPGEKLKEELILNQEEVHKTDHNKIMILKTNGLEKINSLEKHYDQLIDSAQKCENDSIIKILSKIIPTYEQAKI